MGEEAQGERNSALVLPFPNIIGSDLIAECDASSAAPPRRYKWWLRISIFTSFILSGQSIATLLLRLYFDKGGNSQWLATLIQLAAFPLLLPLIFLYPSPSSSSSISSKLLLFYLFLGILFAANTTLFTLGVAKLPVSTVSLISASQLAFNAFFSYFINSQKFTPLIINSLFLLTLSSILLVFQNNDQQQSSKYNYPIGYICTISAAATAGLLLTLTQYCFTKIVKTTTLRVVIDLIIYQSFVATVIISIAFLASKEWKTLKNEMDGFELGKASYVITLVGAGISWQVFAVGLIGLIFEVSSLFSNVIGAMGLPIVPIFAAVFFHDKMSGVKVVAMFLAIWGFGSYIYQEYLDDDSNSKTSTPKSNNATLVNEVSLTPTTQHSLV